MGSSFGKIASLLFIPLLLCACVQSGCGKAEPTASSTPSSNTTPTTLKIGAILSLTGPASTWGLGWQNGIKLAVEELNAQGGITLDDKTYQIEVVYYDDRYDPAQATEAMNKLISEDEVKFVIADRKDYDFARKAVAEHGLTKRCAVSFSPVHRRLDPASLAEWILADGLDVRLGVQLHKILWPDKTRGV